jgi:hypothetical protein
MDIQQATLSHSVGDLTQVVALVDDQYYSVEYVSVYTGINSIKADSTFERFGQKAIILNLRSLE